MADLNITTQDALPGSDGGALYVLFVNETELQQHPLTAHQRFVCYCAITTHQHPQAIPARAGKTELQTPPIKHHAGPSPRVRGKRPETPQGRRSTPGHPRACGENSASPSG
ncbi:MAG: hypothetical protein ACK6BC_13230, partial [Cyanobacteriota bacterium]